MSSRRQAARARQRAITAVARSGVAPAIGAWSGERQEFVDGDQTTPTSVYRWYRPGLRDAASDTLRMLPMQRGASRNLARSNPIAVGAIQTNVDRVIGTGLALVASPNRHVLGWSEEQRREWKQHVQAEFSLWSDTPECDWAGELNFYDVQGLTLRGALESGDCFTVLPDGDRSDSQPYRLRLQTIEADRVGNPGGLADTAAVAGGVRRAAGKGVAEAYHFYTQHPGVGWAVTGDRYAGQWINRLGPSGRRLVLHHYRQLRPEQPRGIPYLAPIVGHLRQLDRYTEAEIKAAVVTAMLTVFVESEAGTGAAPVFGLSEADAAASPDLVLGSGAVVGLAPGEKANLVNPLRPNQAFDGFIKSILQQIGMALGLPLELLTKKFDASYSASKAALLDAWVWFRGLRTWIARSFCQPVYETWLAEAVATGRVPAPGFFRDPLVRWAYTRAGWHGDSMGSLNPKDEVAAYTAAVDARLMTRERAQWELFGDDWYESFEAKRTEQEMLAEADMLPVPKAGAPAPQPARAEPAGADANDNGGDGRAAVATVPAPAVPASPPNVTVHIGAPHVTLHQGGTELHLPESQVNLEAHIESPPAAAPVVHFEVPPAQVIVQNVQQPTRQVITRDDNGEIASIETVPVTGTAH